MTLKQFHVRMWDDFSESLPIADERVTAHTHLEAVEIAFHRVLLPYMDWVQVDEQGGQTKRFGDVLFLWDGSVEYEAML